MQKFIVIGLALFILYKLLTNEKGKKNKDDAKVRERKIATGELVKDPTCGSYVDAESSISVRDGDHVYRFCSYECRDRFLDKVEETGRAIPGRVEEEKETEEAQSHEENDEILVETTKAEDKEKLAEKE